MFLRLAVFVAAMLAVSHALRHAPHSDDIFGVRSVALNRRLISSALRMTRLAREIRELRHEIEEAEKIDPLGFIKEMHARLNTIDGKFQGIFLTELYRRDNIDRFPNLFTCENHRYRS